MKTIKITADFTYDDKLMHGGDEDVESKDWFYREILTGEYLTLHSSTIGDQLGEVNIVSVEE